DTRFFLKFGLHYDEIFKTGLLLNATAKRLLFRNSIISLDMVIGDKPRYYFNYFIDNGYIPGFGIYASGMTLDLKNKNSETFEEWDWFRNEAFIQSTWKDRYAIGGGISIDFFKSRIVSNNNKASDSFINPYVFIKSDTQDDKDFPTRGIYLNAEGKYLDLFNEKEEKSALQAKADLRISLPVSSWYSNRLRLFAGFSTSDSFSSFYNYRLGGIFEQNLGNFVRFSGYGLGQENNRNIIEATNFFQFKIKKNLFLIPQISLATMFENVEEENFLKIKYSSIGTTIGYKSPFGQIKMNYTKALNKNKGIFSVILGHWF
ncbi:MAG: patatin, partial [Cruoricaptor ignavus]|nr:patatin [Cruoricaptor ignavus]